MTGYWEMVNGTPQIPVTLRKYNALGPTLWCIWIKLLVTLPGFEQDLTALLLIQLSVNAPRKTMGDGPSTWAPELCEKLGWVTGSCFGLAQPSWSINMGNESVDAVFSLCLCLIGVPSFKASVLSVPVEFGSTQTTNLQKDGLLHR